MKAAGLADPTTEALAVVISHDCDIAQDVGAEPSVEVIVGRRVVVADGNFTYAKSARRLQLTFTGGTEHLIVDLLASRKITIPKEQLVGHKPVEAVKLTSGELTILQRWLAARYRRSAFPDEFDKRLTRTGIRDRLGKILKSAGTSIAAIYFDVDQGEEVSRTGSDEPYALAIYLLYSTEVDPDSAQQATESAKIAIRKAFRDKCLSQATGTWRDIELIDCEAISDRAMTVQQAESFKRWSADHVSLRTEPQQAMMRDE